MSCKELFKENKNFTCYIIWSWKLKNELTQLIKKEKLEENIKLLWTINNKELAKWMNLADVFILPSIKESFWVVNIEALACWTPVISSINWWSENIIISDTYWLLYKNPRNYMDLLSIIKLALNKDWDKREIVKYAEDNYCYSNILHNYLDIFASLYKKDN